MSVLFFILMYFYFSSFIITKSLFLKQGNLREIGCYLYNNSFVLFHKYTNTIPAKQNQKKQSTG